MKLIDPDVAIDHFHGHQEALDFFSKALASGETLAVSVVTLTEILAGMRPGEVTRTENLLRWFTIIDINETIGRKAGEYLRAYRRSHRIELGDALIAATALTSGSELITRNIKHYPMDGIRVTAPYQRGQV